MTILAAINKVVPGATVDVKAIADTLDQSGKQYGVDTSLRLQAFLAEAAEETSGFKSLQEYGTGAAYEGRADLGNSQPGDGVKFKGRGIFQITGRSNYQAVSNALFGDNRLLNTPEILSEPKYATLSALYFWKSRNLSALADAGDLQTITQKINGGLNGWAERLGYYDKLRMSVINLQPEHKIVLIGAGAGMLSLGIYLYFKRKTL